MAAMIKKVGVIGSGQMGNGIAHVAALAGLDVVLNDVSADRLKSAMAAARRSRMPHPLPIPAFPVSSARKSPRAIVRS